MWLKFFALDDNVNSNICDHFKLLWVAILIAVISCMALQLICYMHYHIEMRQWIITDMSICLVMMDSILHVTGGDGFKKSSEDIKKKSFSIFFDKEVEGKLSAIVTNIVAISYKRWCVNFMRDIYVLLLSLCLVMSLEGVPKCSIGVTIHGRSFRVYQSYVMDGLSPL